MRGKEIIDRASGRKFEEKVYGERALQLLYGPLRFLSPLIAHFSYFSRLYGWLQAGSRSRKKVAPFVEAFDIDLEECEKQTFESFNDFFIRKLKPEARPVGGEGAVLPADGRYWVCESVSRDRDFAIKGQRLTMEELLGEPVPEGGAAVFGRLAPVDCHRFVFPVSGKASAPRLINGPLYSVNPVALRHNIQILSTNKRYVTEIESPQFGTVKMVEVGATCVGSVHSTYRFDSRVERGQEKGYFSFGGSAIILLFEPGRIRLENDLLTHSATFHETRCLMNQPLGAPPSLPPS